MLYKLSAAYTALGRVEESIEPLKQVARLRPEDADAHFYLGHTHMMLGQFDQAVRELEEALRLKPDHAEARERLAVTRTRSKLAGKLEELKRKVEREPADAEDVLSLAMAYFTGGRFNEAARQLRNRMNQ